MLLPLGSTADGPRPAWLGGCIRIKPGRMIEDLIKGHVKAFNARDPGALMAGFADDAVWITGKTTARGRAEFADLFAGAMKGLLPTLAIQNLIAGEGQAAAQLVEVFTFEGAERTDHIAGFYVIKQGRIAAAKIYREGSALRTRCPPPPAGR